MTATLELGHPADGVFVLNSSLLDGTDLLADGPTAALEWESIGDAAIATNARRGGRRETAVTQIDVGTLTTTLIDGIDPIANPDRYRPGIPIRLSRVDATEPDFVGTVREIQARFDKTRKFTTVTIAATDSVQALANTARFGAIAPGGSEQWPHRFARLLQSSPVSYVLPAAIDPETIEATHTGADEVGQWSGAWTVVSTMLRYDGPGGFPDGGPVMHTITGLTAGNAYRFRTTWEISNAPITATIDAETLATSQEINVADDSVSIDVTFIAVETSHVLTISTVSGFLLLLHGTQIASIAYVPWAPSIDLDTNLAEHLDIAATSAGVVWLVDRTGVIRIVDPGTAPVLTLTDDPDPLVATDFGYTNITVAYDTADVVNTITVANNTMAGDPADGIQTRDTFTDVTSVATYGSRSTQVETAIAVDGRNGYRDGVDRFAEAILTRYNDPTVTFSEVVLNVTEHPELVDLIEVYALVRCTWRTVTRDLLIVAIEHNHRPTIHQIVLTLGDTP